MRWVVLGTSPKMFTLCRQTLREAARILGSTAWALALLLSLALGGSYLADVAERGGTVQCARAPFASASLSTGLDVASTVAPRAPAIPHISVRCPLVVANFSNRAELALNAPDRFAHSALAPPSACAALAFLAPEPVLQCGFFVAHESRDFLQTPPHCI